MIQNLKDAIDLIDRQMIRSWIHDLVILKTFAGLKMQTAILTRLSEMLGRPFRTADAKEEARGIDGFIGDVPVSVKPVSYRLQRLSHERLPAAIVLYEKTSSGIRVDFQELTKLLGE